MRVLRLGVRGEDVTRWKYFLIGLGADLDATDDLYDQAVHDATETFQVKYGLKKDGEVGRFTYGVAMGLGFDPTEDDSSAETGPNWPVQTLPIASLQDRLRMFGYIHFTPKPVPGNPEAVSIPSSWVREHIQMVEIPLFHRASVNKAIAKQFGDLWLAWENAGLQSLILTFDGAWAPRFVRGSRSTLSAHSWGTAFDINARWNGLGVTPPFVGKKGSVRKLVTIAEQHGFAWGGFYRTRQDGMHFEASKILP